MDKIGLQARLGFPKGDIQLSLLEAILASRSLYMDMDGEIKKPANPARLLHRSTSTNNQSTELEMNLKRLSLNTATTTALPESSPASTPSKGDAYARDKIVEPPSPASLQRRTPSRTPSATTFDSLKTLSTPTLRKRASVGALPGSPGLTQPRSPNLRRVSSNLASSPKPAMSPRSSLPTPREETPSEPSWTTASVAQEYFRKELDRHQQTRPSTGTSQTTVIIHDACYGHRYARPKTSKAGLNTIVERPERLHATMLGLSTAYVRLGGRHAGGTNPPTPYPSQDSSPTIPFNIQNCSKRISLLSDAVTHVHGVQWMRELNDMCEGAESKLAQGGKELGRSPGQSKTGEANEVKKLHEGDLYLCADSLHALEGALGGVCEAVDTIMSDHAAKRAFVCIRPPGHHCSADYPSGFCWLNNVHVGISHAAINHGLTHAAIIDFDLHHGDGSQSITWSHNTKALSRPKNTPMSQRTAIGYFSIHDINSYPCEFGDEDKVRNASLCLENAHGQTIWNVHLQPWRSIAEFWDLYETKYSVLLSKTRCFLRTHSERIRGLSTHANPRAAIFISAGFDASEWESPGMQRHKVNVPTDFYARFTADIVALSEEEGLSVDGRVISVLEGGYSDRALTSGVLSHMSGLTASTEIPNKPSPPNGLGQEMSKRMGNLDLGDGRTSPEAQPNNTTMPFDTQWWSTSCLESLENPGNTSVVPTQPRKSRGIANPTYTTPTQSFTAKIVAQSEGQRATSNSSQHSLQRQSSAGYIDMPPAPPPDVDWATASRELCKLLIPTDRQTRSFRPEELNAEATRARRERQSTIGLPSEASTVQNKRMQLRDRKSKVPENLLGTRENKLEVRSNRRKTIAAVELLEQLDPDDSPTETVDDMNSPIKRPPTQRRRSSATSTLSTTSSYKQPPLASTSSYQRAGSNDAKIARENSQNSQVGVNKDSATVIAKIPRSGGARKDTPKPRAPKKTQPATLNRITSSSDQSTAGTQSELGAVQDRSRISSDTTSRSTSQEIDGIESKMKKMSIKLNVPPKEEHEARAAKKKPATKPPVTKTPRNLTAPSKEKNTTAKARSNEERDAVRQSIPETSAVNHPSPYPAAHPPVEYSMESSADVQPLSPTYLPDTMPSTFTAPASDAVVAIDHTNQVSPIKVLEGPSEVAAKPEPLLSEIPEPVASTDSQVETADVHSPETPKRTKQDLPIFTSTSPIPFGEPNRAPPSIDQSALQFLKAETEQTGVGSVVEKNGDLHEDIWAVPVTPHQRK
ncbi:hypothetical protein MMC09_000786 [Bachmanniomyces sp. S44760]|nr:hypothetical protein [Bachmanniomyces sp. S44760]